MMKIGKYNSADILSQNLLYKEFGNINLSYLSHIHSTQQNEN